MTEDTETKLSSKVLRLRGLPFQATEDDIKEFFTGYEVVEAHICRRNGRATGEAYVQLDSEQAADDALKALNKQHMGRRYIEIFEAFDSDMAAVKAMKDNHQVRGFVLRLRGLPYSASAADVEKFFEGIPILKGQEGVVFTFTPEGRRTGEAYVEFEDEDHQREALKRHRETMGTRYIEIFVSSKPDMYQAMSQSRYVASDLRRRWAAAPLGGLGVPAAQSAPYGVDQVTDLFQGFGLGPGPRGMPPVGRPNLMGAPGRPDALGQPGLGGPGLQPVGARKPLSSHDYPGMDAPGPMVNAFGNGRNQPLSSQDYSLQQQQQQQQLLMQQQYLMQLQGQGMRYEPWGSMGMFGGLAHQGTAVGGNQWYKQYGGAGGGVPGQLSMGPPYHVPGMAGFGMPPGSPVQPPGRMGMNDGHHHGDRALSSTKESVTDGASLDQGTPTHKSF